MKMTRRQWLIAAGIGSGTVEATYWVRGSQARPRPYPGAPSELAPVHVSSHPERMFGSSRAPMGLALSPDGKIAVGLSGSAPFGQPSGTFGLNAFRCDYPGQDWVPLWEDEGSADSDFSPITPLIAATEESVVVAHHGGLWFYGLHSGILQHQRKAGLRREISALAAAPSGVVAVRSSLEVEVLGANRLPLLTVEDRANGPLALSPDGRILAFVHNLPLDPALVLTRVGDKQEIWQATLDAFALAFSRDGRRLAVLSHLDRAWKLSVHDALTGRAFWTITLDVHSTPLPYLTRRLAGIIGGADSALTLDFSHDGARLALAEQGRIRLFDAHDGSLWRALAADDSLNAPARFALFQPDGTLLVPGQPFFTYLTPSRLRNFPAPSVAAAATLEGDRLVYPTSTRVRRATLSTNRKTLLVAIEADSGTGSAISQYELRDGKTKAFRAALVAEPQRATLSPDGRLLAVMENDFSTTLRDALTGKSLRNLPGSGFQLQFAPDGKSFGCTKGGMQGGTWTRYSAKNGRELVEIVAAQSIAAWTFSPDGKRLAMVLGSEGETNRLEVRSALREDRPSFQLALKGRSRALAFSRDQRYVACVDFVDRSSGNLVTLLLIDTVLKTHQTHDLGNVAVEDMAFTRDGRHLTIAIYGRRRTLRLSDFDMWEIVDRMDGGVTTVAPNGSGFLHAAENVLSFLPAKFR